MNNFLTSLFLLMATSSHAQEIGFSYGLGVFNSAKVSPTELKVANLAYRLELYNGIYWQTKVGYWGDGSGDPNRHSSFYLSTGPGLLVDLNPVELRSGWGLTAINRADSYLGGVFPQFNGEVYAGLRDKKGDGMGLKYEHISSAGLITPNLGRDFLMIEMSTRW